MWGKLLEFVAAPVTKWVEGKQAREYMKEEGALAIKKAEVGFKIAEFEAKAKRAQVQDQADIDYDMQAQRERRFTIADEVLMFCTVALVACHFFFPAAMAAGWAAMGYTSAPWWLEFIIVGIFVSVFGLMRLFKIFAGVRDKMLNKKQEG